MSTYAGSDWIENTLKQPLSEFGRQVADLVGDVFLGIYHLTPRSLEKVDWQNDSFIQLVVPSTNHDIATYDGNRLTMLVLFAHDRMIRIAVEGAAPGYLRLTFSPRYSRNKTDPCWKRHPTLEYHVAKLREHFQERHQPEAAHHA